MQSTGSCPAVFNGIVNATVFYDTRWQQFTSGLISGGNYSGPTGTNILTLVNGTITYAKIGGGTDSPYNTAELRYNPGLSQGDVVQFASSDGKTTCQYQNYVGGSWSSIPQYRLPNPQTLGNALASNTCAKPSSQSSSPANAVLRVSASCDGPTPTVTDPVNIITGNMFLAEKDYAGAPNTELALVRYYNSQDYSSPGFGANWHSTYHRSLTVVGRTVQITRADGRGDIFILTSGVWTGNKNVPSTLVPIPASGTQTGWKLTLADDSVETYSLEGLLQTITTRAGLVTTLAYNASNQLVTVTGPFGHTLTFAYDASGRVNQMTAPDNGVYTYAYDANSNLTSVTYPDGRTRQYAYGNSTFPNALTGITDENGNAYSSWTYDTQNRATTNQHAGGANLTTINYSSHTVTDARSNVFTYNAGNLLPATKPRCTP